MPLYSRHSKLLILALTALFIIQCTPKSKSFSISKNEISDTCKLLIEAEDYINSKFEVALHIKGNNVGFVKTNNGGWLEYKLNIPKAGRYKIQLFAQTNDSEKIYCWVEDYADNTKGRTYNITGNMLLQKSNDYTNFSVVQKEGSPMDTGIHNIRLHYDSGIVNIDKLCFTLMDPHKNSPQILTQQTNGKQWKLTWSDEFDGVGLPDSTKWLFDLGNWGWGNNELQYYTVGRTENARQEDGKLIIEARKNDYGYPWTSARLTTRGRESFLYGKIEFRAKTPGGRGSWSAGWLLGDAYVDEHQWPDCGEVDVLETFGFENDAITGNGKAHASIYCGACYFKLDNQLTKIERVENMNNEYHNYTMEWLPESLKIFIDGKKYFDYHDTRNALSRPFNKPQNLILSLAMGGRSGGINGVDESLTSQKLIFDYVRVYSLQ